jgi:hypothetical protein
MKSHRFQYLSAAYSLQTFLALALTASITSDGSFFMGFTKARLAIMAVLMILGLAILAMAIYFWRKPLLNQKVDQFINDKLVEQDLLASTFIFLIAAAMWSAFPLIALLPGMGDAIANQPWRSQEPATVIAIITRLGPFLLVAAFILLETALFLGISYRHELWQRSKWSNSKVGSTFLIILITSATLFQWLVLVFRFRVFYSIPGWYYQLVYRPFDPYDLLPVIILIALIGIIIWTFRKPGKMPAKLMLIFLLGWCLQLSFGFIEGQGIESLRLKFFDSSHAVYAKSAAVETRPFTDIIKNYDTVYDHSMFTLTKPPGVMLLYTAIDRLVNGTDYSAGQTARVAKASNFIAWTFPFFALLVVFLLYFFFRRVDGSSDSGVTGLIAAILFIVVPSIDLFVLFADEAIYPVIFLLVALLVVFGTRKRFLPWAFLIGCLLFLAMFVTYSLTTLLAFTGFYILLDGWAHRHESASWHCLLNGIGVIAGFSLLFFVFQLLLNYNLAQQLRSIQSFRYGFDFYTRVAQPLPTAPIPLQEHIQQIVHADFLNNIEFATSVGFPLFILFVVQEIRSTVHFLQNRAEQIELAQVAFFGTFLTVAITGTSQGEVARLWMFFVPIVVLFAAREVLPMAKRKPLWLILLVMAQLATVVLTYHFQDFRMR